VSRSWRFLPAAAAFAAAAVGCRQALSTIIDLPPPQVREAPAPRREEAAALAIPQDTARPPLERTLNPDSARALLPRDHAGNIDWVAAMRSGVISPRSVLPGRRAPTEPAFQFAFDFMFRGPDTTVDALFPHSTHTEWLTCQTCHPRIARYQDNRITMADIFQGRFCGRCHGKVAYPVMTGCERCHLSMTMPENRAQPEFIGTIAMRRVSDDSGTARGLATETLPPAVFPHWLHRIRYRCKACHVEVFEPEAGANRVTMAAIATGQACGRCHNGTAAFPATIGTCQRCHQTSGVAAAASR